MDATDSTPYRPSLSRTGWGILAALALLAAWGLAWGLSAGTGLGDWLLAVWRDHRAGFLADVSRYPVTIALTILLVHALLAMLALPGASVLMLVTGAAYGPWTGTLLCLTGCTAGASACMLAARYFLRPLARRKLGARLAEIDGRIATDGAAYLFSLRLVPIVPFALANVAAGLSSMRFWTFTWISFIGMLAGTFVYVNAGTEIARVEAFADLYSPRVLLSLAALALLPWLLKLAWQAWQHGAAGRA
jgi:uncharacterized membrane protein YdjX (TVP38/TMEM64 family)